MAHSLPFTPPSSPSRKAVSSALSFHGVRPIGTPTANCLADSLGVSPLYRQQNSARWQSAVQIYQSYQSSRGHSRASSPIPDGFHEAFMYPSNLTPALISDHFSAVHKTFGTPLSLVEISHANRKRHAEAVDTLNEQSVGGPLELEAIAAVHELSNEVRSIAVSEILPRTADLIFVNIKTVEGHPYTLELTMKGWRIASLQCDNMNGDYKRVELHAKYYDNARQLLEEISPAHSQYFTNCLTEKLTQLHIWRNAQEKIEDVDVETVGKQRDGVSTNSKKKIKESDGENNDLSDEGLVFIVDESSNRMQPFSDFNKEKTKSARRKMKGSGKKKAEK